MNRCLHMVLLSVSLLYPAIGFAQSRGALGAPDMRIKPLDSRGVLGPRQPGLGGDTNAQMPGHFTDMSNASTNSEPSIPPSILTEYSRLKQLVQVQKEKIDLLEAKIKLLEQK